MAQTGQFMPHPAWDDTHRVMRYPGRIALCVSSQAGCGMNCPFCATGQAGLTRNMSTAEIVDQVGRANHAIAPGAACAGKLAEDVADRR